MSARTDLAGHDRLAFADQDQAQVGEGRQVAAGPDRPSAWHHRMHLRVQERDQRIDRCGADARVPTREYVGAQQHHRPDGRRR
jgi:hypothetical protein